MNFLTIQSISMEFTKVLLTGWMTDIADFRDAIASKNIKIYNEILINQ